MNAHWTIKIKSVHLKKYKLSKSRIAIQYQLYASKKSVDFFQPKKSLKTTLQVFL